MRDTTRWLRGGCHCGDVRFRVRLESLEALACNCSICRKKGYLHLIVRRDAFEALRGAESMTTYRFGTGLAQHTFCRRCGMHPFYVPRSHPDGVSVNARCLDDDLSDELAVVPFDGNAWEENIDSIAWTEET